MRLTSYLASDGPRAAGWFDGHWVDLNLAAADLPSSINELLALGPVGLGRAAEALPRGQPLPPTIKLLPPIPNPRKIICVGKNYAEHARETGAAPPAEPVFFCKFPTTLVGHGQPIILPTESNQIDYEAELVAIIGRGGRAINRDNALEHVAAYCCGNDITARDWQRDKPGGQWLLGKSFDTFAPIGPALTTADEIVDPQKLDIQMRLNGRVMQQANTSEMLYSIAELIAYVSRVCTLEPGDLLFTGTPAGVGFARQPPVFLKDGDFLEVEIESLGILENMVMSSHKLDK
jgi:2-keto-4-pentenoate hydratase/2-oxohepta-3-ene-1,7-dioic acid hydratase in catechol pathway